MSRKDSSQRERILDAATAVFAEQGLNGATIRTVGRQAGVNSALIYYYFEDKETLFGEAVRRVLSGLLEHLQAHRRPFTSARARLEFLVDGLLDYYRRHGDRMQLMLKAFTLHPRLLGRVLGTFLPSQQLIPLEVLQEGMDRGDLRRAHPLHLWWSILAVCLFSLTMKDMLGHNALYGGALPAFDLRERRAHILDLLLRGLARPEGKPASRKGPPR
jgi:TetR/AcrR family transcriptional regulator